MYQRIYQYFNTEKATVHVKGVYNQKKRPKRGGPPIVSFKFEAIHGIDK